MARRGHGRMRWTALLAMLGLALSATSGHAQAGATESAVKATYLYKFAPFVEWPTSAFASPSSPFYLCVMADDPFGAVLDQAASGQRVDEHPVAVRRLRGADGAAGCHILYLGAAAKATNGALRNLRGTPVLTVSDQTDPGAIIRFVVKDGRVRFEIDTAAATANGVMISSKLLSLAVAVRTGALR